MYLVRLINMADIEFAIYGVVNISLLAEIDAAGGSTSKYQ